MKINVFELKADTGCSNENVVIFEDINNEMESQNGSLRLQTNKYMQSKGHNKDE